MFKTKSKTKRLLMISGMSAPRLIIRKAATPTPLTGSLP